MMNKNYLTKEEVDRLLESKFEQAYKEPTKNPTYIKRIVF